MLDRLAYHCLKLLPPETAHGLATWAMKHRIGAPGPYECPESLLLSGRELFGVRVNNSLGLAAGFDKNGELVNVIEDYGFGFIEIGSVTLQGGKGNPKPRMFRLHDLNDNGYGIMNRMGLNGEPAYVVAERSRKANTAANVARERWPLYGINIAKTNNPKIVGDEAIDDIANCYRQISHQGIYHVLNVSCPNTKEGRTFEDPAALRELLAEVNGAAPDNKRPLLVKFSPTLGTDAGRFDDLIQVCKDAKIAGYVFCNTFPTDHPKYGKGGLSGFRVKSRAVQLIKWARQIYEVTEPIIACGGIFTAEDILDYKHAGANFFQIYNGFVRGPNAGPKFAQTVLQGVEEIEREATRAR